MKMTSIVSFSAHFPLLPFLLVKLLKAIVVILLLAIPKTAKSQSCAGAPSNAALTTCMFLQQATNAARQSPPPSTIPLPPGTAGLPNNIVPMPAANRAAIPATPYECMDLGCFCSYLGGNGQPGSNQCTLANGQPLTMAVRTEYRMMSNDQRQRYTNAVRQLKANGVFDQLSRVHRDAVGTGNAHGGPAFLPWHREYLKRVEFALRMVDPSIALPYWDSTLDGALPTPADSIVFSAEFMGQQDASGRVTNGPFAPWQTLEGNPFITRRVGADGRCISEADIQWTWSQTDVSQVLAYASPTASCPTRVQWGYLELTHGNPHIFVGGDMFDPRTSANDPLFYLHHSFVDLILEGWLQRQPAQQRQTQYPPDNFLCEPQQHFAGTPMIPFTPLDNINGLSNAYTANLYTYAPRPSCNSGPNCGSQYLFCDRSHGTPRCASKVRDGGDCRGFVAGEDVCWNGVCNNGRCVGRQQRVEEFEELSAERELDEETKNFLFFAGKKHKKFPVDLFNKTLWREVASACFNEHVCCGVWAYEGQCEGNPNYMNIMCKASCKKCTPSNYNLTDDCSNRHPNCEVFASQGLCKRYKNWMGENCRKSCKRCGETRSWRCTKGRAGYFDEKPKSEPAQCAHNNCYNGNICCEQWSRQGNCNTNTIWMHCNCPISCGLCLPRNVTYGPCIDYNPNCVEWARQGDCAKNEWMLANCRQSCGSCMDGKNLEKFCQHRQKD